MWVVFADGLPKSHLHLANPYPMLSLLETSVYKLSDYTYYHHDNNNNNEVA